MSQASAYWDSAYWDSAYWDSAYWDSAYWDSAYWDSAYWDSAGSIAIHVVGVFVILAFPEGQPERRAPVIEPPVPEPNRRRIPKCREIPAVNKPSLCRIRIVRRTVPAAIILGPFLEEPPK